MARASSKSDRSEGLHSPETAIVKSTQSGESSLCSPRSIEEASAPGRSILFTNRKTGIRYSSRRRHRVRVWLWTPSVPLMTRTA